MKHVIALLSIVLFYSCALHHGSITSTASHCQDKNIEYADVAVGYSKVIYLFGFGGMHKDALVNEAKRNLFGSYVLKNGQSFENTTLDFRVFLLGPFVKMEAIVVADVVQRDSSYKVSYSNAYRNFVISGTNTSKEGFKLNESVLYNRGNAYKAKIVRLNRQKANLFYINSRGAVKVKNVAYHDIYRTYTPAGFEEKYGYKLHDTVNFVVGTVATEVGAPGGEVVGINDTNILLKINNSDWVESGLGSVKKK